MSQDLARFGIMVFLMSPHALVLSVVKGVLGCSRSIYSRENLSGRDALQLQKIATVSASEADDITCLMIFDSVMIAPLLKLSLFCFPKKNVLPLCFQILALIGMKRLSVRLTSCRLPQIVLRYLDVLHSSPGIVSLLSPDFLFLLTVLMQWSSWWLPQLDQLLLSTMQRCLPRIGFI